MATIFSSVIDMGMTQSLVRFGTRLRCDNDQAGLSRILIAAIKGKVVIAPVVCILGFILIHAIGFGQETISEQIIVLVLICGFVLSFFSLTQGVLQIQRRFRGVSALLALKGTAYLAVIVIITFAIGLSLLMACFLFIAMTVMAIVPFLGSYSKIVKAGGQSISSNWTDIRFLLNFGKWIGISGIAFSLVKQMPIAAIFSNYGPESAANFSIAMLMVGTVGVLSMPLMTVLMPDLSRIRTKTALKGYLASTYRFLIPLTIALTIGLFLASEPLITYLYGEEYSGGIVLFRILLVPFILVFAFLPMTLSLTYVFNRPSISSMSNVAQLIALVAAISVVGSIDDVVILVAAYGVIKAGGSIGMFLISIFFIRSSNEQLHSSTKRNSV